MKRRKENNLSLMTHAQIIKCTEQSCRQSRTQNTNGLTISSDLSWNTHVDITAKKATTSLNFLKRNLHSCPSTVKEKCYKSLVRPIIEYASCVWDPHSKRNIDKLEMVQRRAARFVKGDYSRTSSLTAMLADLKWNTLQQRRIQSKTVMLYRVVHKLVSIPVTPFLIPIRASRGHNMRCHPKVDSERSSLLLLPMCHPYVSGTSCLPQQSQHRAWRPSGISFHPAPCTCRSTLQF